MVVRNITELTDITTTTITESVEPIGEIYNCKFNLIIISIILTVCAVALENLYLMVTGILLLFVKEEEIYKPQ